MDLETDIPMPVYSVCYMIKKTLINSLGTKSLTFNLHSIEQNMNFILYGL